MKHDTRIMTKQTGRIVVATRVDGVTVRGHNYPAGYKRLYGGEHRKNDSTGINKGFGDGITDRQGNRQDGVWEE